MPLFLSLLLAALPASAKHAKATARARETFDRYVTQLQQEPGNEALLKKLFRLVSTMRPAPKVPFDAAQTAAEGDDYYKTAKTKQDYGEAARSYQRAILGAPWVPYYYERMSRAYEKAGNPKQALAALKIFLIANPAAGFDAAARKRLAALKKAAAKGDALAAAEAKADDSIPKPDWASAQWTALDDFHPAKGPPAQSSFPVQFSQAGRVITGIKTVGGAPSPMLRATITEKKTFTWEYYAGDQFPGACRSGWLPAAVSIDALGTRLSYKQPGFVLNHCDQDGGYDALTLTR